MDIGDDDALFSRYQSGGDHMSNMAIQHSYRELNRFLGWVPDEGGFYKATSHMMRKFSQHPVNKCRNALGNKGAYDGA